MTKQEEKQDYNFKVTLAGDGGTGKSCIVYYFHKKAFLDTSQSTIGVQFCTKHLAVGDKNVKLSIWDTAGQDKFNAITKMYYRGSAAVVLVYDITYQKSFETAKTKLQEVRQILGDKILVVLVGNKADQEELRQVKKQKALKFAKEQSLRFFQTSAMNGTNIEQFFRCIAQELTKAKLQQQNIKHSTANNTNPALNLEENNSLQKSTLSKLAKSKGNKKTEGCC